MSTAEKYLKPEVVRQIKRLDLRAQFIVKGFMQGLHSSPFHGFSVEFSEHRKYSEGDDPKDIDWLVYAKTDKYYVKKFEAETNITGWLCLDISGSMNFTNADQAPKNAKQPAPQDHLTKFDYSVSLAAALCYLMVHQQDPVGMVAFDDRIRHSLPPRSKRTHLGAIISLLAKLQPRGRANVAASLTQVAAMLRHRSLVMVFSDLLHEDEETLLKSLHRLRHGGHDVILFHVLDAVEEGFPFRGMVELEDPETGDKLIVDADAVRESYLAEKNSFCGRMKKECVQAGVDYVRIDTGMQFDKALVEYLLNRRSRG